MHVAASFCTQGFRRNVDVLSFAALVPIGMVYANRRFQSSQMVAVGTTKCDQTLPCGANQFDALSVGVTLSALLSSNRSGSLMLTQSVEVSCKAAKHKDACVIVEPAVGRDRGCTCGQLTTPHESSPRPPRSEQPCCSP